MSVHTTADDRLDRAKEAISTAEEALRDIVVNAVWGHDEYKDEWRAELEEFYKQLTHMRTRFARSWGG